jgi:RNA polymerase sigma-70 factor (ECF subfamily)
VHAPSELPDRPHILEASSSERLLTLVAERSEDALAVLYDRHGRLAYTLALRVVRDRHLAEDVVQEAFVAVWQTAGRFRVERGSARTWILTLVHRRAVDRVRREQRHHDRVVDATWAPQPTTQPDASIEQVHVRKALMRLSPGERRVIALAHYEGLTQAEVATALGLPLGTVKSRTARALARLASVLGEPSPAKAV